MFITFEGIDLSGKSTQAKLLYKYLKKTKKRVILLREPGGTKISEKIRKLILDKRNTGMDYVTEFLLFSASRRQLTEEVIKPHLKQGYIVICDRYYDSSTAYQGYGGKIELNVINRVNKIASGNLIPDLSLLINISYNESLKRKVKNRNADDRIEQKKKSYFNKVVKGYLAIAGSNKKRFKVINGKKPIEVIHNEIISIFDKFKT